MTSNSQSGGQLLDFIMQTCDASNGRPARGQRYRKICKDIRKRSMASSARISADLAERLRRQAERLDEGQVIRQTALEAAAEIERLLAALAEK